MNEHESMNRFVTDSKQTNYLGAGYEKLNWH
jgi:hypothetical protein